MDNGNKKITIYDIAQEAGVSASQVSRAISGRGYVSEENRAKIAALVEKYDYRPNAVARSLQKGKSNMVGLMIPHMASGYFASVYYEFEREMTEKGYITIVFNGKSYYLEEYRILRMLEEIRVDAAVIMGGSLDAVVWDAEYVRLLQSLNHKLPCVLCSERAVELGCSGAYNNMETGLRELICHYAELGHKKLGILGGLETIYPSQHFKEIVRKYAAEYGLEIRPEWVINSSYGEQDGEAAMKELLRQKELPTALCCINDDIAIGAMGMAMDAGLRIPQDISVAGYDGVRLSEVFRPRLTTVQLDFQGLGRKLAEAVERSLKTPCEPYITLVDSKLTVRESTFL